MSKVDYRGLSKMGQIWSHCGKNTFLQHLLNDAAFKANTRFPAYKW